MRIYHLNSIVTWRVQQRQHSHSTLLWDTVQGVQVVWPMEAAPVTETVPPLPSWMDTLGAGEWGTDPITTPTPITTWARWEGVKSRTRWFIRLRPPRAPPAAPQWKNFTWPSSASHPESRKSPGSPRELTLGPWSERAEKVSFPVLVLYTYKYCNSMGYVCTCTYVSLYQYTAQYEFYSMRECWLYEVIGTGREVNLVIVLMWQALRRISGNSCWNSYKIRSTVLVTSNGPIERKGFLSWLTLKLCQGCGDFTRTNQTWITRRWVELWGMWRINYYKD